MTNIVQFKSKNDYSEHEIIKEVDGEKIICINIDDMTEDQFKKYCCDTGSEYFQRLGIVI